MILVDFSQVVLSEAYVEFLKNPERYSMESLRQIVLMKITNIQSKHKNKYGSVVLCVDYPFHSWRKNVFPQYKANRKRNREESDGFDWKRYFDYYHTILENCLDCLPCRIVVSEDAEGDDVIAVLTREFHERENILIWSSDRDFVQLQKYPNVSQYSYLKRKMITIDDPVRYLDEKILTGDRGDGIPNCLSEADCFVEGKRQKKLTEVMKERLLANNTRPEYNAESKDVLAGIERNRVLIDFDKIPEIVSKRILATYSEYEVPSKGKFHKFLVHNGMMNMIDIVQRF